MRRATVPGSHVFSLLVLWCLAVSPAADGGELPRAAAGSGVRSGARAAIGVVLGRPVYRDEIVLDLGEGPIASWSAEALASAAAAEAVDAEPGLAWAGGEGADTFTLATGSDSVGDAVASDGEFSLGPDGALAADEASAVPEVPDLPGVAEAAEASDAVSWTTTPLASESVASEAVPRSDLETALECQQVLEQEMIRLFVQPLLQAYVASHAREIEPTAAEIAAVAARLADEDRQRLARDGTAMRSRLAAVTAALASLTAHPTPADTEKREELEAERDGLAVELEPRDASQMTAMLLGPWKLQRHLYDRFGGGRVLWQQMGVEAFDAMRRFLEGEEAAGRFAVTDPALRRALYAYWTTRRHGNFLTDDPLRVREMLLAPSWLGASAAAVLASGPVAP